jgi:hypothetical protein
MRAILYCSNATGLSDFNIANTSITGAIPDSVGALQFLRRLNIQNTPMFCCASNGTETEQGPMCRTADDKACLPRFLTFSANVVPPTFNGRLGGPELSSALK